MRYLIAFFAVSVAVFANAQDVRTIISDRTFDSYAEAFITNLPVTLSLNNGVLCLKQGSTNLWTSSEAHDWGSWLPTGTYNPGSGTAVAVNLPLTLQPVGTEWSASGGFSVLSLSPGSTMTALGSDSAVTWTYPDGSTWRWVAESIVDVPAIASGITMSVDEKGEEVILIDYAVSADAAELSLLRSDTYAGAYSAVTNVDWTQVSDALRRATVPTGGRASGFFRARGGSVRPFAGE